jgi:hypothetical protein
MAYPRRSSTLQFLPLTAEGDFAPILALDGETLGGDAALGQLTLNFAMH